MTPPATLTPDLHGTIELCYRSSLDSLSYAQLLDELNDMIERSAADQHWIGVLARHLHIAGDIAKRTGDALAAEPDDEWLMRLKPEGRVVAVNETQHGALAELGLPTSTRSNWRRLKLNPKLFERIDAWLQAADAQAATADPLVLGIASESDSVRRLLVLDARTEDAKTSLTLRAIPLRWVDRLDTAMREMLKLTPAELQILRQLVAGRTLEQIAQARSRSLHTVRTQVKVLLRKAECRNQMELVQLATSMLFLLRRRGQSTIAQRASGSEGQVLELSAGQALNYFEYGDPHGLPWIFLHSALLGPQIPEVLNERFRQAGLRVIALALPGYGQSKLQLPLDRPGDFARAFELWLDHLHIEQARIVASVVGCLHAHSLATALPTRIERLLLCGGVLPLEPGDAAKKLPISRRLWWSLIRNGPELLLPLAMLGHRILQNGRADKLLDMAYAAHACDKATIHDPDLRPALLKAANCVIDAGPKTFLRNAAWQCANWTDQLSHGVPSQLLHGADDEIVPPDQVRKCYVAIPNTRLTLVPDAGQLLLYRRPERVIECMLQPLEAIDQG